MTRTAFALAAVASVAGPQAGPLDRLGWLAGCWEMKRGTRTTLEMWMPPAGGLMLGASRTTADGAVREFEHVRLHANGGRLVYTALPSGQAEASFTSTEVSDSGFTVEEPATRLPAANHLPPARCRFSGGAHRGAGARRHPRV